MSIVFNQLQERITNDESSLRKEVENMRAHTTDTIGTLREQINTQIEQTKSKLTNLSREADQKIEGVLQQAKKFSAKEAIVTYAKIFQNEADDTNKPAIRRWELILMILILTEIAAALSLFFLFLPEVLEISKNYGTNEIGLGLIISALFLKIFILSIIAVAINYSVKSLSAQNHLYATNKFKANSLASFQAFLDATDNGQVIDSIIQQVASAVYSKNVSGYLSKDDSSSKTVDRDIANLAAKIIGR